MSSWQPSYNGEPRPDNRTFALAQRAIDNGWNPAGRNTMLRYRFYFFINKQYIDISVPGLRYAENEWDIIHLERTVHDFIFDKKFAKALAGKDKWRKLLQGAVLSRSPVDYMYRETIDKTAKIGRRI